MSIELAVIAILVVPTIIAGIIVLVREIDNALDKMPKRTVWHR